MKRQIKMSPQKTFVYLVMVFPKIDAKGKYQSIVYSTVTNFFEYTGYVCFLEIVGLTLLS